MNDEISVKTIVGAIVGIFAIIAVCMCIHSNDIQEFTITQSPSGVTEIVDHGGMYFAVMPKKWRYPKVQTVYFSNEKDESKDSDGVKVRFSNKGEGDISSQVVYRLFNSPDEIMKMHSYVAGNTDRLDDLILAKLKDIIMDKASKITSSDAIENRERLAADIRKDFVGNVELKEMGIYVEQFSITQIAFDKITTDLFAAQQKADLAKKTAEAEKTNLIMQKERTEAEAARAVAEAKGKADVEKMTAITNAEKTKKLAEIAAQQKLEVEKLEKEQALVKIQREKEVAELEAQKIFAVAEIQKKTEAEKLDIVKLESEQKIAAANARAKELELSKALSETDKAKIDLELSKETVKWEAIGQALGKMTLPKIVNFGGNGSATPNNPLNDLISTMTIKNLETITK